MVTLPTSPADWPGGHQLASVQYLRHEDFWILLATMSIAFSLSTPGSLKICG